MDQTMSGECRIKSFETQPTGYNREMPRIIHKMVKHIKNHAANVAIARIFLMFDHFILGITKSTHSLRKFLSYRNQSYDLFCYQWTGFFMIRTLIVKEFKRLLKKQNYKIPVKKSNQIRSSER